MDRNEATRLLCALAEKMKAGQHVEKVALHQAVLAACDGMTTETSNARGEVVAERHALYGIRWVKQLRDMRPGTQWFIEGREWPIATVTSSAGVLWHMAESEIPHGTKYYTAPPPAAARGEVPYDRDLIARMLDVCGHPKYTLDAYREQARLLREADNAAVANVGTVDARGDVRGLVDYDAGLLNDFGGGDVNWWQDYLRAEIERANEFWREQTEQALAAEGVQAGEVGQAVAWCQLTQSGKIAYFDGKPMIMVGPVGNEHHTVPLCATPPSAPVGVGLPEGFTLNLAVAESALRKLTDVCPVTPPEAAAIRSVIIGARALAQQPAAVDEAGKVSVRESALRYCIRELNGARRGDNAEGRAELVHHVLTAWLDLATQHQEPKS